MFMASDPQDPTPAAETLDQLRRAVGEFLNLLGGGDATVPAAPSSRPPVDPEPPVDRGHDAGPSADQPEDTRRDLDEPGRRLMNELEIFGLKFPEQSWLSPQWKAFLTQNVGDLISGLKKNDSKPDDVT